MIGKNENKMKSGLGIAKRAQIMMLVAPLLVASIGLGACQNGPGSRSKNKAPVYIERPVEGLYNDARDLFDRGDYAEAVTAFEEVDRQHPFSEWSRRSVIMAAFSNYKQAKYEDAIAAAQNFVSLYQGNPESSAYAYYLIAICYFEQIVDVGRDQRMTELALASLNQVVQRYPTSAYARDARLKMDMARDQLAGKEMEIGRYYLRQDQHLAAIIRFRRVVDVYQTTSHVPEALHRLVEAYVSIGVIDEATKIGAVLGYNYPGSDWYADSYALLNSRGVHPNVRPTRDRGLRNPFKKRERPAASASLESARGTALAPATQ